MAAQSGASAGCMRTYSGHWQHHPEDHHNLQLIVERYPTWEGGARRRGGNGDERHSEEDIDTVHRACAVIQSRWNNQPWPATT